MAIARLDVQTYACRPRLQQAACAEQADAEHYSGDRDVQCCKASDVRWQVSVSHHFHSHTIMPMSTLEFVEAHSMHLHLLAHIAAQSQAWCCVQQAKG